MDQNFVSSVVVTTVSKEIKKYTGAAARVLSLLIGGCSQVQAAKAIGVTEGYVSQLCQEPEFQLQIADAIREDMEKAVTIDANYLDIEKALSEKLKSLIPYLVTPDSVLRSLKAINGMNRKVQGVSATNDGTPGAVNGQQSGAVRLQVPQIIIQNFVTNPNREVVAVDSRELTTLNSASITTLVAEHKAKPKPAIPSEATRITYEQPANKDKWGDL